MAELVAGADGPGEAARLAATDGLRAAHAQFRAWMFNQALPFWAGPGHASSGHAGPGHAGPGHAGPGHAGPGQAGAPGGAREELCLDGTPSPVAFTRMRVQARQLYVFSHAARLGWTQGERLAQDGYRFITLCGEHPGGGWVRRLSPSGRQVLDPAIDLYDQAFVLFALAWYARLTGEAAPLQLARRTAHWIGAHMAAPHGGYHNVLPVEPGPRQQNPHMHLLEAMLALYETTGDDYYAGFAQELVSLFQNNLFDRATGTLGEFFTASWAPAAGAAGDHVEPGHHHEWVWLLDQAERLLGAAATAELEALYGFALAHGTDPDTALVWNVVARNGLVRDRGVRLWPQTEALKAHAAMTRRGRDGTALIVKGVGTLLTRFFAGCPAGAWIDRFDAAGMPAVDRIPTSSFYHVFMAYAELDRLLAPAAGAAD